MAKKRGPNDCSPTRSTSATPAPRKLLADLRSLIEGARSGVAQAVNSVQVTLYWQIGHRIETEILRQ
jgi:hypothetical protein